MLKLMMLLGAVSLGPTIHGAVDTLRDTADIDDCFIYSWVNCNPETYDEDCRRFNAGRVMNATVGKTAGIKESRMLLALPGWDRQWPDSAELLIYCYGEADSLDRRIFLYPLSSRFYEGTENDYNLGGYPDPDSGATWLHAYLDVGDADSVMWNTPGGDYTTAVACTALVTGPDRYVSFRPLARILHYWDTSGADYGMILVNENASPAFRSAKTLRASEAGSSYPPMVILYFGEHTASSGRRGSLVQSGLSRQ